MFWCFTRVCSYKLIIDIDPNIHKESEACKFVETWRKNLVDTDRCIRSRFVRDLVCAQHFPDLTFALVNPIRKKKIKSRLFANHYKSCTCNSMRKKWFACLEELRTSFVSQGPLSEWGRRGRGLERKKERKV